MAELVHIWTLISMLCTPMRAGVFTMEATQPHLMKCEKRIWDCIEATRKETGKHNPPAEKLEKCFR